MLGCSSSSTTNTEISSFGEIAKVKEASGIGYCSKNNTIYVAADNGMLFQLTTNGELLRQKNLSSIKNHDFEGIAYDAYNDEILVAVEGSDNILVFDLDLNKLRTVNVDRTDDQGRLILEKDKENGLEGIAVSERGIYLSNQSFERLPKNDPSVVVKVNLDFDSAQITDVIDHGYTNISGLSFYQGTLYMVTDSNNILIKYDLDTDTVLGSYKIKSFDSKLKGAGIEGVTFDAQGNIYFADDTNGKIYKFKFN